MAGPSENTFPSELSWPGEWPPVVDGDTRVRVLPNTTSVVVSANGTSVELTTFDVEEGS